MTTITRIDLLPGGLYNGTDTVGIVITSGITSFFKVSGTGLNRITAVHWYPQNPASLKFKTRELILVDDNTGTFMIQVLDNYLSEHNRGGHISFRLDDGDTITFPAKTYGRVSLGPLWTAPNQGLITG